jgi:hypothetical protein
MIRRAPAAVALLLAGCSAYELRVPVMMPAAVNLANYRRVAIDRFVGDGGMPLQQEVLAALRRAPDGHGGTGLPVVLPHEGEDWSAAPIVVRASLRQHGVADERIPAAGDGALGAQKRQVTACVAVLFEVSDHAGHRVLDSVLLNGTACVQRETGEPVDTAPLLAEARAQVVRRWLQRVLPPSEWIAVPLYDDARFPDLAAGNSLAAAGDWAGARAAYARALAAMSGPLASERYQAMFNLGVALEFEGDFDGARGVLTAAREQVSDPRIDQELQRLTARELTVLRLRQQGTLATPPR